MSNSIQDQKNQEQLTAALRHALGIGVGWGAITLAITTLANNADRTKNKEVYEKKLKSYVRARYPEVVPMPTVFNKQVKQLRKEEEEELKALSKTASGSPLERIVQRLVNPIPLKDGEKVSLGSILKAFSSRDVHPLHVPLTAAALLGGSYGGYTLARKYADKTNEVRLKERIERAQKKLDELFIQEYQRTRGLGKEARSAAIQKVHDKMDEIFPTTQSGVDYAMRGAARLYLMYAAGAMALAFAVAKDRTDATDPKRQEREALAAYAKERAMLDQAPILMSPLYTQMVAKEDPTKKKKATASSPFKLI